MTVDHAVSTRRPPLSWLALTLIFAITGLSLLAALAIYVFGSLNFALGYLRGERLILDHSSKSFGIVLKGERPTISFELTNTSDGEIRIVGARSYCTCASVKQLPILVPPRRKSSIEVGISTASKVGPVDEVIELYSDSPAQAVIAIHVVGSIIQPSAQPDEVKN